MKYLRSLSILFTLFNAISLGITSAEDEKAVVPPGRSEIGKTLFVSKGCYQCHNAGKTKLPKVELEPRLVIELGDEFHANWTRDDYAKAIMNPKHVVAEEYRIAMMTIGDPVKAENSPMPEFTELLTVSELIHLVTFLEELGE